MEVLRQYQADIMMILGGICGIMAIFVFLTNTMSKKRKFALMLLEISAVFLLISDRRAYIFRGDPSDLGWFMVRLSNFLVFFLTLVVIYAFNLYLIDLYTHKAGLDKILIDDKPVHIRLYSLPDDGFPAEESLPTLVLFDALDARVHEHEARIKDLLYFEYGQLRFDGRTICEGARRMETSVQPAKGGSAENAEGTRRVCYEIEAVRVRDHARIRISDGKTTVACIAALPDSSRYSYASLTGDHCLISSIRVTREEESVAADAIPRIAEEISFIAGCPEGDVPNIQIDGWRSASTVGLPITGDMRLAFHAQSLPTARLVWHCPFVSVFTSQDGTVAGEDYREFLPLRLDGENWDSDAHAENEVKIDHTRAFPGWNEWKALNRQGFDYTVTIRREGRNICVETENAGISISSHTTIKDEVRDVYVALTGDQCALTNIRALPVGREEADGYKEQ